MIGILRAFALLRWRLFVNGLRGRRRDQLEQVSRISRLLVIAIVAATFVPGSCLMTFLAFVGGRGLAQGNEKATTLLLAARGILFVLTAIVAISPILRFGGAPSSVTRLALLPIPRRLLFGVEIAAQLADPWLLAIAPAILALPAGLLSGGAAAAAGWALLAGLAMLLFLATLGSASSLLGALLFRNRRLGEYAAVSVLVAVMCAAYLPMLIAHRAHGGHPGGEAPLSGLGRLGWAKAAPSEWYLRAVEAGIGGGPWTPVTPLATLVAVAAALAGAARWAFGRLLDAPGERRVRSSRSSTRMPRLPGLTPGASAVASTTFRLMTRSVRGRVILFTAPIPVLMMGLLWRSGALGAPAAGLAGIAAAQVGGVLALLAIEPILADQFAVDRAGLTLTFLAPLTDREIVLGKTVGCGLAALVPFAAAFAIAAAQHPSGPLLLWAAVPVAVAAAYVAQSPAAAFLAATFPAPYDLMKLKGGNAHPLASILGMLATMIALGASGGPVALTFFLSGSAALAFGAGLAVLGAAWGIAAAGLPLAARVLAGRRENLAMTSQGR